jgi:hypothetical protein
MLFLARIYVFFMSKKPSCEEWFLPNLIQLTKAGKNSI